jgi:hypothetical protein
MDNIEGLHWEFNGSINSEPPNKQPFASTTMKPGAERFSGLPLTLYLHFFTPFWEILVTEINRYATQKLQKKQKRKD